MGLKFHPKRGTIVCVNFDRGFVPPEMVKSRLAVVVSKPIQRRQGLCTVVPLSVTPPEHVMPYHCTLEVPFQLPRNWGEGRRWVKGDMICSVSWDRTDLLRLGKDHEGKRIYQTEVIPDDDLTKILKCVLHGVGLSSLTNQL